MSYQVLARKWRPKTFEELVGQEHVLGALVNALEQGRLHHAYLFTGTRGVGKTTIARILARALNCEQGVTSKPCNACAACDEITEGRFVDLIEVDAASRTKVEDTRDLLENVQYRPTRGRFKIYLIDEVHMLSNHSFNALLKTLEEPPEHVKFLLATTDPQKLPVTVLSRCLQFNLKNLPAQRISEYLENILGEEQVPFDSGALSHLSRAAAGSMRDALSLTDQAISHGGGKLSEQDVTQMLGTVDRKRIQEIVMAILENDGEKLIAVCQELAQFSIDYLALVEDLIAFYHAVAVAQVVPGSEQSFDGDAGSISEFAGRMAKDEVQLMYQMLLLGRKDLAVSPDLHMGFEMLMLRLLAFQPQTRQSLQPAPAVESISEATTEHIGAEVASAKKPEAAAHNESQTLAESEPFSGPYDAEAETEDAVAEVSAPADVDNISSGTVLAEPFSETLAESFSDPRADVLDHTVEQQAPQQIPENCSNTMTPANDNSQGDDHNDVVHGSAKLARLGKEVVAPKELSSLNPENWVMVYRDLPLQGMLKSVASHMVLEQNAKGLLEFRLASAGQPLYKPEHAERLASLLTSRYSQPVEAKIEMGGVQRETPAEIAKREHREAISDAREAMLQDPIIRQFSQEFQVELVPDSVTLVES